jgi:murein DD-endopeptidase MepM/ murein hydrolase activator NlpD
MGRDAPTPDAFRSLVWRLSVLSGIFVIMGAMFSRDSVRYGTTAGFRVPVTGVDPRELVDSFADPRDGNRVHEAIDILAPRGTLVVAASAGRVRRIFSSSRGGLGVYQVDGTGTRCFYYAHLDHYANGLEEGRYLNSGDAIGYVGTTGNAPEAVPHLHFAVMRLDERTRCSEGQPLNPIALFR